MKNNISVKPEKSRLVNILDDIEKGEIKIPIFQRSLVWTQAQMKDLFDSIVKGYPIGSLLLWMPKEEYKCYSDFGPYKIDNEESRQIKYILDGCQRLTTLFGTLTNPKKYKLKENDQALKKYSIYYNLREEEFTYLKSKNSSLALMPLYKIVDTFEYLDFLKGLQENIKDTEDRELLINNAKKISKILIDYEIPYTIIVGGDINGAVEIFSRVNSTGTDISEDWMLSALLYNNKSNFLLSDKISWFLNKMKCYNFENLKRDTILNCISNATDEKRVYFDIKVEDLSKHDKARFEELTNETLDNIEKAIKFLYIHLYVIDYKLLPYPAQLIFIAEFFRLKPYPTSVDMHLLERWFWITTYSNYFSIYSINQQRSALQIFRQFALGKHDDGIYEVDARTVFSTQEFPKKIDFSGVRSKALQLFLLRRLMKGEKVEEISESIKEQFIFYKKGRSPGNIVLRLASEFEQFPTLKEVNALMSTDIDLSHCFINSELKEIYNKKEEELFIKKRRDLIIRQESEFVEELGIVYTLEDEGFYD